MIGWALGFLARGDIGQNTPVRGELSIFETRLPGRGIPLFLQFERAGQAFVMTHHPKKNTPFGHEMNIM